MCPRPQLLQNRLLAAAGSSLPLEKGESVQFMGNCEGKWMTKSSVHYISLKLLHTSKQKARREENWGKGAQGGTHRTEDAWSSSAKLDGLGKEQGALASTAKLRGLSLP